jgi:hypothetical protein
VYVLNYLVAWYLMPLQAMRGCTQESFFDEWMKRQSDVVQGTALAFAERMVMDASVAALKQPVPTTGKMLWNLVSILCVIPRSAMHAECYFMTHLQTASTFYKHCGQNKLFKGTSVVSMQE